MADYIYSMKGLTKVHPPDKKVVEDLYLSFLPNAKIGVIGVNGTGKSTILRIMGFDYEKLSFFYNGLDQRLTGPEHRKVFEQILA